MLLLLCGEPSLACSGSQDGCAECVKESEFSWNPDEQYTTTRLRRFYALDDELKNAMRADHRSAARSLAREYLALARAYRCNWNYGNAVHDANSALGVLALREGNVVQAVQFLQIASESPGSPQLDNFGPSLALADALLKQGRADAVKRYLRDIKTFWEHDRGKVEEWIEAIDEGRHPDFGYHLKL